MTDRSAFTAGLRAVADFLDKHPEVPLPYLGFGGVKGNETPTLDIYLVNEEDQKAALATIARAMGGAFKAVAEYSNADYFMVWRKFEGIVLCATANREQVCTRVVTGTEDREVVEVVEPAVTRTVTKPVEVVEWKCEPLLAPELVIPPAAQPHLPDGSPNPYQTHSAASGIPQGEDKGWRDEATGLISGPLPRMLTTEEHANLPEACACHYFLRTDDGLWELSSRKACRLHDVPVPAKHCADCGATGPLDGEGVCQDFAGCAERQTGLARKTAGGAR